MMEIWRSEEYIKMPTTGNSDNLEKLMQSGEDWELCHLWRD